MSVPAAVTSRRNVVTLAVVLVMSLLIATFVTTRAEAGGPLGRGIDLVYVTVATNFPDALGVGPGAAANNAPILLVPTDPPVPDFIRDELWRLDPKRVVIVGGTAAVSAEMETALGDLLPFATVERIDGANRYETNANFSAAVYPVEGWVVLTAHAFGSSESSDDVRSGDWAINRDNGFLNAPINLPHGSEVIAFEAYVADSDGAGEVVVRLIRQDDASSETIAQVASGAATTSPARRRISTTAIDDTYSAIDNQAYGYVVTVSGADDSSLAIERVHVKYRLGAGG